MVEWPAGRPVQPGDVAPDFTLPLVSGEGQVSLAHYRGRSSLFLAINRGLWCSFCRRYVLQLGETRERLLEVGVDTLVIVATEAERARFYVRHRPVKIPLAADPGLVTHLAYGLPNPRPTPDLDATLKAMRVEIGKTAVTASDLTQLQSEAQAISPAPSDVTDASKELPLWDFIYMQRRMYPYELTADEQQDWNMTLGTGQFLIDRDGVVRWTKVQGTSEPPGGLGNFATHDELLAAARTVTG